MKKKKICVVTGSSAEYGPLKLLIKQINSSKKLELLLLVTGMHLLERFGKTINQIISEKIPITKTIPMYDENDDSVVQLGKAVGKAISKFTETLAELKPDVLLITGDRFEVLAAVISASTLSIPIAHIQGGDSVEIGQIDEQIRHAITKFSHIHFAATKKSAERIKLLGEEEWRIHNVGAIAMDMVFREKLLEKGRVCKILGLDSTERIILCIQHPYFYEPEKAGQDMSLILQVLRNLNLQTVILYPNNDSGCELIIEEIEKSQDIRHFKIFPRLDRETYLSLMKNADLLIGNSSSGLIESPVFKLPTINIGNRNKGRESGENVLHVSYNLDEINQAIQKALSNEFKSFCQKIKNPYGNGTASEQIVKILEGLEINEDLLRKRLTYKV